MKSLKIFDGTCYFLAEIEGKFVAIIIKLFHVTITSNAILDLQRGFKNQFSENCTCLKNI
jgi:hypothetical protein